MAIAINTRMAPKPNNACQYCWRFTVALSGNVFFALSVSVMKTPDHVQWGVTVRGNDCGTERKCHHIGLIKGSDIECYRRGAVIFEDIPFTEKRLFNHCDDTVCREFRR